MYHIYVSVLSAVAAINKAVEVGDSEATLQTLCDPEACIPNLDEQNSEKYQKALAASKNTKLGVS